MRPYLQILAVAAALFMAGHVTIIQAESTDLQAQVEAVERAFAKTMADRDHGAFMSFLSEETIFLSGPTPTRGKKAVAEQWKPFFDGPKPPFSWEPEIVTVLDSEKLALSTGPVYDPDGLRVSTFTSIWRQDEPGVWRIVFDRGNKYCE